MVAGRIRAIRGQGAIIFLDLDDGTGIFQVLLKKDETGEEALALFSETVDIGDFIECSGPLFVTKRKEKTLLAKSWRMLAKALRPLPDKWAGLTDIEERSRKALFRHNRLSGIKRAISNALARRLRASRRA